MVLKKVGLRSLTPLQLNLSIGPRLKFVWFLCPSVRSVRSCRYPSDLSHEKKTILPLAEQPPSGRIPPVGDTALGQMDEGRARAMLEAEDQAGPTNEDRRSIFGEGPKTKERARRRRRPARARAEATPKALTTKIAGWFGVEGGR